MTLPWHQAPPPSPTGRTPVPKLRRWAVVAVALVAAVASVLSAATSTVSAAPVSAAPPAANAFSPGVDCASLASVDFSRVETVLQQAVEETLGGHQYCSVTGYISPQTQFQIVLPTSTWKGDYLQQGCAGLCGFIGLSVTDPGRATGQALSIR